jgi:hypothetical protein
MLYDGVDIHVMTAEADSGRSSVEQVRGRLVELWSYLTANQTRLINYGREYREGHRISTARVESTVDQLVDWRMEKKQLCVGPDAARRCCSTRVVR